MLHHFSPKLVPTTLDLTLLRTKMSITSTTPKCSHLFRLLHCQSPKPLVSFLHLSTIKPSLQQPPNQLPPLSSPTITQIIEILNSNDNNNTSKININTQLDQLLFSDSKSLSSDQFLQISRHLGNSSIALNFLQHLRSNPSCPDVDSLSSVFQAVFELASREPNWEENLFHLFNTSKELNVPLSLCSTTLLFRSFGRCGLVEKLLLVYEGLDTQKRNTHVRNVLIDELLKNGCLDDALQVLDEMLEPNFEYPVDEDTGEIVFGELLKVKKYKRRVTEEEIIELVKKFGGYGIFPGSIRLTQWITKFCRYGRCDKSWELLHCVMELDGSLEVASCNALLTGLAKNFEFKKINVLMNELKDMGVAPNVVTFGISINHLCKARRLDEALDLFQKMREGKVGISIEPDVVIYNTLIDGLCKVGRLDEGLEFMRRMGSESKHSPTTATYNCLIDGFCKAGELEKSLELFDEMKKEGIEPNIITVNSLVSGMCRHGKVGSALEFYREMKENGLEGNAVTYTALIGGFCGVNNIKKAMELFDEMREKCLPDAIVYYTLISGLSQAGLMDDADMVLSEMKTAGFRPDIGCYNMMINGFCKKNRLTKVHELLQEMKKAGFKPDSFTYNTLISYFSKTGDLKMAHKLLRRMVKDNVFPTVVTYGTIIHACCSMGELDEAMKIFQEMRSSTRVPPNTVIYNTLISSLCQQNNLKAALSLLDDMKLKDVSPNANTFNSIFKGLQQENWLDKAFELMDRMIEEACNPDYITLEVLTEWLSGFGHADKLRRFVQGYKVSASTA